MVWAGTIRMPDTISSANETARNDQDALSDKGCLWEGWGTIRMPDTIKDADGSGWNDKLSLSLAQNSTNVLPRKMPIVQMYYRVKMVLVLRGAAEKSSRGLIRP